MTDASGEKPAQRIDLWRWYARFFRSRSEATAAVKAGHVRINQQRTKPARDVRVGDVLDVQRGQDTMEVRVRGLPVRRGPAPEAAQAYEETAQSQLRRAEARVQRASRLLSPPPTVGRPDKRTQRLLRSERRRRSVLDDE